MHLLWQSEIKIKAKAIACSVLNTIHLKNKKHAVIRATLEKQRATLTNGLSRSPGVKVSQRELSGAWYMYFRTIGTKL